MGNRIRRAGIVVEYSNSDITKFIEEYISKITIVDNFKGAVDSVSLSLRNDEDRFLKRSWALELFKQLKVDIITENWENENEGIKVYPVGIFNIDSRSFSKNNVEIKALSIPLGEAQDQANTKTWQEISLKDLGEEFAKKYNLRFKYIASQNPELKNLRQEKESDFSFLQKISSEEGLNLKVAFNKLILFDEEEYEKKAAKITIDLKNIDYSISEKTKEVYDAVELTYTDPMTDRTEKILITDSGVNKIIKGKKKSKETSNKFGKYFGEEESDKKVKKIKEPKKYKKLLKISRRSKSGDLEVFARKRLKKENAKRVEISFTIPGNMSLYAGTTFILINAGIFDGKYIIQRITKNVPNLNFSIEAYLVESRHKRENRKKKEKKNKKKKDEEDELEELEELEDEEE